MSKKASRKQKAPGSSGALAETKREGQAMNYPQFIRNDSPCQLSPDSQPAKGSNARLDLLPPERRLKFARLAQDLASFYYEQSLAVINAPDPVFNKPFGRFALCAEIAEELRGVTL